MFDNTVKGPSAAPKYDGSALRIGIIHARWNDTIIKNLVSGAKEALLEAGVKPENIHIESVAGSWELPYAVKTAYAASQIQAVGAPASGQQSGADLLGQLGSPGPSGMEVEAAEKKQAFDAVIAVGCLIKGQTMHFEYISESVSNALMQLQFQSNLPIVFGLLTCLTDEQALLRAGVGEGGHNHGTDWGRAAVEMGFKRKQWESGVLKSEQ